MRQTFWQRNRRVLRPWSVFVLTYAALLTLFFLWPATLLNRYLTAWTARTTAWALWLLGADGRADGTLVTSSIFTVKIIDECTAVFPIMIFLAAVVAYPSRWRKKLVGAALGVPALLLVNLIRLVSLFYIGHWFPDAFETAHLLVWQSLIIFFTVLLWLLWAVRIARPHES